MEKEKQIKEMAKAICNACNDGIATCKKKPCSLAIEEATAVFNLGYRKIPEGSVVLSKDELDEELETCKAVMIVSDEDGERYVSFEDYKEYTHRLGKIARQRKAKNQELEARIKELENLLDAKCDRCIESDRKATAKEILKEFKKWAREYYYKDTVIDENGERPMTSNEKLNYLYTYLLDKFGVVVEE